MRLFGTLRPSCDKQFLYVRIWHAAASQPDSRYGHAWANSEDDIAVEEACQITQMGALTFTVVILVRPPFIVVTHSSPVVNAAKVNSLNRIRRGARLPMRLRKPQPVQRSTLHTIVGLVLQHPLLQ